MHDSQSVHSAKSMTGIFFGISLGFMVSDPKVAYLSQAPDAFFSFHAR